jgi:hypothetical protein
VATGRYRASTDDEITIDYFAGKSRSNDGVLFAGARCRCTTCAATTTTTTTTDGNSDV